MDISAYIKYKHKALLNREVCLYGSYIPDYSRCLGFKKKTEVLIFTVRQKSENDNDAACWENSTSRLKDLIREQVGKISGKLKAHNQEISGKLNAQNKENKEFHSKIDSKIDSKFEEINKKISE